ncbi:MAG: hypothetical protein ABI850_18955 [Flavobacterium sp.]
MEIHFVFDKKEPFNTVSELKSKFEFDGRNGLNYIMFGEHWSEIEDQNRLIHQIESVLNVNLSLLDYWNDDVYDKELEIQDVQKVIENLKNQIESNPNFYQNISYGFNIVESYFKKQFLNDINYLIQRFEINIDNGAKKIKYETD